MTDIEGEVFQHVEYFPFGETWVEEHSNRQRTPYLFTGKKLDEDTQLYYFGARYYDPRTSVWQSPDPMLGNYLFGGPAGGVHAPANLNVYAYVHQRPVIAVDPDGEFLNFLIGAAAGAAVDLAVQGVLVATGAQDSVSWSSVAVSAASGATGVGLSSVVTKNAARVAAGKAVAVTGTMAGETAIGVAGQAALGEDINVTAAVAGALVGEAGGEAVGALLRRGDVGDAAESAAEQIGNSVQVGTPDGTVPDGIVYRRTNPETGACYIGQCKSPQRFEARQGEHNRANDTEYQFEILGRAEPGTDLDVLEESLIRSEGGINRRGGLLENQRHQMNDQRYRDNGGTVPLPYE